MLKRVTIALLVAAAVTPLVAPFFVRWAVLGSPWSPDFLFVIRAEGMAPALVDGDRVVCDPESEPVVGSIVAFWDPRDPSITLVDRVIATGGQTVDISTGIVTVDGTPLIEPYVDGGTKSLDASMPLTVPPGELWVMGDNRANSVDSRTFGPVRETVVRGVIVSRYWPWERRGMVR